MGLKIYFLNHTKISMQQGEWEFTKKENGHLKHYINGMNHKNLMISMEILVTAFKSPSVMSLIAQSNNHTLKSKGKVAYLQSSSNTVHLLMQSSIRPVGYSDLPEQRGWDQKVSPDWHAGTTFYILGWRCGSKEKRTLHFVHFDWSGEKDKPRLSWELTWHVFASWLI